MKTQIIEHEGKKYKVIEVIDEWITIPELKIKVSPLYTMTYIEAEEYCKKNNVKMLNVLEAGYIFDNKLIKDFCKEREWLEHYSKETRKKGYGCSAVGYDWSGDWLSIGGDYWVGDGGRSFGVRFKLKTGKK